MTSGVEHSQSPQPQSRFSIGIYLLKVGIILSLMINGIVLLMFCWPRQTSGTLGWDIGIFILMLLYLGLPAMVISLALCFQWQCPSLC